MLIFGTTPETIPVTIAQDATTGLPLLSEQQAILQIILAYLALPYSVIEYGCGKKASLIINQLLDMGIPPYAIARGMILERDMSASAMAETDHTKRPHALVADNPLHQLGDTSDPRLREMLEKNSPYTRLLKEECIQAGSYLLRPTPEIQFVTARSHIYTIITLWDEKNARAEERVIDPSLYRIELFPVKMIRDLLHAPEGLLFNAPLLGRFRLEKAHFTDQQQAEIKKLLGDIRRLDALSVAEHAKLVRQLSGAEPGSLGDPLTWTYANNIKVSEDGKQEDKEHFQRQEIDTGRGDGFGDAKRRLIQARENRTGEASAIIAELRNIVEECDVRRIVKLDADWSANQLEPLADTATLFVYYKSLCSLAAYLQSGQSIVHHLESPADLRPLRGIGVRLRRRIEWLTNASRANDGRIDARAFTPGYINATAETIRQMNLAGLTVFIDRVGNIHGLCLDQAGREALHRGEKTPADFTALSIAHVSHIDTVNDAGKFDGRLGVLGGLETAHVLNDLEYYFDLPVSRKTPSVHTLVTAFIGEEMTFTGHGIAMPGSAAVCGRAEPVLIYDMRNLDGERFGDCLHAMLIELKKRQLAGSIELFNDLAGTDDGRLLEACSDPTAFFTPHTFERHIEQGPFLDRANVPLVMVGTIMSIHQEDFFFKGAQAEAAALELNRRLRALTHEAPFKDARITAGILEGFGHYQSIEYVFPALRWTLEGELNHAGATPIADRRDPGVAAARMAREFLDWFDRTIAASDNPNHAFLKPLISHVRLAPGTNRNVIPGSASMTVALVSDKDHPRAWVDDLIREDLTQTLEGFSVGTLARRVAGGGEGVRLCRVEPVSYTTVYHEARLSVDLRADRQSTRDALRKRIDDIINEIKTQYRVGVQSELQQQLPPFNLEQSGQTLLMERSYGGSHNPRETELLNDIVRGCILQIAVTRQVLSMDDLSEFNLFKLTESHMPKTWLDNMARFTCGAPHDTGNIAAKTRVAD